MGLQGGGKNIILVIDTSSSMPRNCGEKGIDAIRREINRTINGFSEKTGARGIRRVLEERIEDPLSELIILGQISKGQTALAGLHDGKVEVTVQVEQVSEPPSA